MDFDPTKRIGVSNMDLVNVPELIEGWIVIFSDRSTSSLFAYKSQANDLISNAHHPLSAFIAFVSNKDAS